MFQKVFIYNDGIIALLDVESGSFSSLLLDPPKTKSSQAPSLA